MKENNEYGFIDNINVIKYKISEMMRKDTYTYGVLKMNNFDTVLITGFDDTENTFLFAVSELIPLAEWLSGKDGHEKGESIFLKIKRLTEDLTETFKVADGFMIPRSEIILDTRYVFYDAGKKRCRFLCLPVLRETEGMALRHFFPAVICGAEYENDRQKCLAMDIAKTLAAEPETDDFELLSLLAEKLRAAADADNAPGRKKLSTFFSKLFSADDGDLSDDEFFSSEVPPSKDDFSVLTCRSTGAQYPLVFGPDYLGTDPEKCSICIQKNNGNDNEEVFCKLSAKKGKWYIKNIAENEDIFINGEKTAYEDERELKPADLITIGKNDFVFSYRN